MSRDPVDIDPESAIDEIDSITLTDGECIVSISGDVAVRGTPAAILHWATKIGRVAAERLTPDEVQVFARTMLMDMTAEMFKRDIPDEMPPK
jgi:hypothetical protein